MARPFREAVREVRILLRLSREDRIESDARSLVQKLARESAAIHAANVARVLRTHTLLGTAEHVAANEVVARLDRTARNARTFRDIALLALRRELGLPDDPTQAECGDWGEAP